jgi:hypothetical protein
MKLRSNSALLVEWVEPIGTEKTTNWFTCLSWAEVKVILHKLTLNMGIARKDIFIMDLDTGREFNGEQIAF